MKVAGLVVVLQKTRANKDILAVFVLGNQAGLRYSFQGLAKGLYIDKLIHHSFDVAGILSFLRVNSMENGPCRSEGCFWQRKKSDPVERRNEDITRRM